MLNNILLKLGVNERDIRVYFTLFDSGQKTATNLSKLLSLPKSSLYTSLYTLQKQGLIKQSVSEGEKLWTVSPPETIQFLLKEKSDEFNALHKQFEDALPALQQRYSTKTKMPSLTYFYGKDELRRMFSDLLLYKNIDTCAFWSIWDALQFLGKPYLEFLNKKRIENNISVRVIWPHTTPKNTIQNPFLRSGKEFLREIRIAPHTLENSMGYWIYQNKTSFLSSKKESFGFIVESEELATMLRKQFEFLWKISIPQKPVSIINKNK